VQWLNIAPTENDTWYRHEVVQGQVHDENGYVSGGIQGHAGLFQTAPDTATVMHRLMFADTYQPNVFHVNSTTVTKFITPPYPDRSSRALVWDTNDSAPSGSCGSLSVKTYMHTGFTGTLTCADPTRGVIAILHCNRVYPTRNNTGHSAVRTAFTTAVQRIIDAHYTSPSVSAS
jgi:CubicO group peptidase (beta-lactamase class C family)